jgi:hypothetical protein
MLASNNNQYGLYLTPEELNNNELMAQLKLQQAAQLAQQQLYAYGWHDPNATQQKYSIDKWEPIEDLNKKLWNIKPIKFRLVPVLFSISFALLFITIIIKLKGIA